MPDKSPTEELEETFGDLIERISTLYEAVVYGQLKLVAKYLADGRDPDEPNSEGDTPLALAAQIGARAIVETLIHGGAVVDRPARRGQTPLMRAAYAGEREIVELLLDAGADVHARDDLGETPLSQAVRGGHPSVVRMLMGRGADPTVGSESGTTPMQEAFRLGGEDGDAIVALLSDGGAEMLSDAQSPLVRAADRGMVRTVKTLLGDAGEELLAAALRAASGRARVEIVGVLLAAGADVEAPDEWGRTPLLLAARAIGPSDEVVANLLGAGAELDAADDSGKTALSHAVQNGKRDVVALLLDGGADPDPTDDTGRTPLAYAVAAPEGAVLVRALLDAGADVQRSFPRGSILHEALWGEHASSPEIVEILLEAGTDPEELDDEGRTPVDLAARHGRVEMFDGLDAVTEARLQTLLRSEEASVADLREMLAAVEDQKVLGRAFVRALREHRPELALVVVEAGLEPEVAIGAYEGPRSTPTRLATEYRKLYPPLVETLLDAGADVSAIGADGNTLLHWVCGAGECDPFRERRTAIRYSEAELRELERLGRRLVEAGADLDVRNEFGQTPLEAAEEFRAGTELVGLLREAGGR